MLLPCYSLCFFHQQHTKTLMLEFNRVPSRNRNCRSIYMQFTNNGRRHFRYLWPKSHRTRLSQPKQTNQNILFRIFIRKKRFPPPIRNIISSQQLHTLGINLFMNLLHPNLPHTNILTRQIQIFHPRQRQLPQVSMFHPRTHQRHGNIPLNTVYTSPRRNHGHNRRHKLHQLLRCIIPIPPRLPQFIQSRPPNDKGWIKLQPIRSKHGILKVFLEPLQIPIQPRIWQIGHHVRDNLESTIFGQMKRITDCRNGMSTISLTRNGFIDGLNTNFDPCTTIRKHFIQMRFETIIWPRLNCDSNAFSSRLFRVTDCLLDGMRMMTTKGIM
mmetsp:Transcript_23674/g.35110  ORF Transcript_23674/g.35110 Transcript_23674/m.35110 type:complete len:326 (-) Transcript_23674:619-1596(-)